MKRFFLLTAFLAVALFFSGANLSPALAETTAGGSDQPQKYVPPLEASFSFLKIDDRYVFEIKFTDTMVTDRDLLFKNMSVDERPFSLSSDWPLKVFWKDEAVLRIEPDMSELNFEKRLNESPLLIYWPKNLKSANGLILNFISGLEPQTTYPYHIDNCRRDDKGLLISEIGLVPFEAKVQNNTRGETADITISFTRTMVDDKQIGQLLDPQDVPVILTPALPNPSFYWTDRRTLTVTNTLTRDDFLDKVSDRPFSLAWKDGLTNVFGQNVPDPTKIVWLNFVGKQDAAKFYFSTFTLQGLNQTKADLEGWAEFELNFNKPVDLEQVKKSLEIKKIIFKKQNNNNPPLIAGYQDVKSEILGFGGPKSEDETTVRFRVKDLFGYQIAARIKNLKSADGRGTLPANIEFTSLVSEFFTIRDSSLGLEERYPWKPYYLVSLKEQLKFEDLEKYIRLDPPLDFTVLPYGYSGDTMQILADFTLKPTTVTLLKGLPSQQGVLTEDVSYTVQLPPNLSRQLMFTGRGRYLSPEKPLLVKLAGRNVDSVRLQAWRIYENNLPTIINVQDYNSSTRAKLTLQFSKNILNKVTDVQAGPGEVFERLLDLSQVMDEKPHGAYLLKLTPESKPKISDDGEEIEAESDYYDDYYEYYSYDDYYSKPARYLPVMISDIGLAAHTLPGEVNLWATSLSTSQPVTEGKVKFYDQANQVVAEGVTDSKGLFSSKIDLGNVVFATVEKDGDLNYLLFGSSRTSFEGEDYQSYDEDYYDYYDDPRESRSEKWFGGNSGYLNVTAPESIGPMRSFLTRGYEAFLFQPRDMFKPGETVRVKGLIRDKNILPPTDKFPVMWRINDPDGRTISQGQAELNIFGGLDFAAEIPFSARTGSWTAAIYLPGSDNELGQVNFTVEDFVPPRLALNLTTESKTYQGENPEIVVKADVRYLFGAPGAELNWEMDAVISPASFRPKDWEGFDFSGQPSDFSTTSQRRALKGQLDESGQATISYHPNLDIGRLPNKLAVEFVVSAQEDGGRWNAKRISVDYFPREIILGYKAPESTAVKKPLTFDMAAITPEGQAASVTHLDVRISQVQVQYYNNYRYGRYYRQSVEELKLLSEAQTSLNAGRGSLSFTPPSAGDYQVDITDPVSGESISRRISVYGLETSAESTLPQGVVDISFDRETYKPGDQAKVKIRAPFPGQLWLTVETTSLLYSTTVAMSSTETEVSIPVDETIKTNAVVTATVVRPLAEGQTGYRSMGLKSLEIDREIYRLNVGLEVVDRLLPSSKNILKIKMTDFEGQPVTGEATVALVDEGVLSLSGFKTPNPWRMFTVGRDMITLFYDLYEQLLPLEKTNVPFLTPGGGDGLGRSGLFSPFKRNQEILSIFLPSVVTDENGQAEVELALPEYSGQGRLMVVASSRDRFGSASKSINISRDMTSEATLPLALAPGDKFELPIRVFLAAEALPAAGQGASIKVRTEGPLSLAEPGATFNLKPGEGQTIIFQAEAKPAETDGDQAGLGRLIIESIDGLGQTFSQTLEVAVRPPYPRVVKSESVQTKKTKTEITVPTSGYLKGTLEANLTLAKSPAIEAARAVNYLKEYPYGCLEQTTSRAWLFVAADDLLSGLSPEKIPGDHISYGLNAAVQRLVTMQTNSGGFAYWPGGDEVYEWGSVYAIHFLTEASKKTELPHNLLDSSITWLQNYLSSSSNNSSEDVAYNLSTKAYALYVLALNGEYRQSWVNALKDREDGLSPSARIFLAGAEAIHSGNSKPLGALDKKPLDLSLNTLNYRVSSLESAPRNQALKLLVWTEVDPLSKTTENLAWQVSESGRSGLWSNTQENGLAVLALGNFLNKSTLGQPYQATLSSSDGQVLFSANNQEVAVAGPKKLAPVQDNPLTLKLEGEGRPYYTLTVGGVPLTAPEPKAQDLELSRTWILEDGQKIPLSSPQELSNSLEVAKGDRVVVEITVKADKPLQNLVLVDLLPGGFEIENPKLVPTTPEPAPLGDEAEEGIFYPATRLELREDRLVVIDPWIREGQTTYRYTLRAVTPGQYTLPPTVAEGMYEPNRQAILASGQVRVLAR